MVGKLIAYVTHQFKIFSHLSACFPISRRSFSYHGYIVDDGILRSESLNWHRYASITQYFVKYASSRQHAVRYVGNAAGFDQSVPTSNSKYHQVHGTFRMGELAGVTRLRAFSGRFKSSVTSYLPQVTQEVADAHLPWLRLARYLNAGSRCGRSRIWNFLFSSLLPPKV